MRLVLATLIGLMVLTSAAPSWADDAADLAGSWVVTAAEFKGIARDLANFSFDTLKFADGKMVTSKDGEEVSTVSYEVIGNKKPKRMNWSTEENGTLPTIYDIQGSTLRICFPIKKPSKEKDIPAPKTFKTKGKNLVLITAEKE